MKVFKVVLKVIVGVVFWGYIFALMFIEDTYHPFMKKDADTAAKTVVEKTKPARTQVRTQTRIQAPAAPKGISVYASTDREESSGHQLYFSNVATKDEAKKSAAAKCRINITGHENYLKCKEFTFFTQGCLARYRVGGGHTTKFGPTAVEAQTKAKQSCDVMAENSSYSCVLDANICIESSVQYTRKWAYAAFGITETMDINNNTQQVSVEKTFAGSLAEAKNIVEDYCISTSGKSCRKMYTISGDQCIAIAISGASNYSIRSGAKKDENSLMATVKQQCRGKGIRPYDCGVRFFCAGS